MSDAPALPEGYLVEMTDDMVVLYGPNAEELVSGEVSPDLLVIYARAHAQGREMAQRESKVLDRGNGKGWIAYKGETFVPLAGVEEQAVRIFDREITAMIDDIEPTARVDWLYRLRDEVLAVIRQDPIKRDS